MKKIIVYLFILSIPVIFFSCYPGGVEYYSDTDIVRTDYDIDHNFTNETKYFMPDSIYHAIAEGEEDNIDRQFDEQILARIESNMTAAGYTLLPDTTGADVYLTVTVTSSKYTGIGWIPGGGWWGGWYPGWGWGGGYNPWYPWYPGGGYPVYYSYTTGSLILEMVPPDEIDEDAELVNIVWQAVGNGLLSSSPENISARIDRIIDQMYVQSKYLNK